MRIMLTVACCLPLSGHAQVIISEFMAANRDTLFDENGEASDWIELYNGGTNEVSLGGWHLTDDAADLSKWTFPQTNLGANCFLVVWASGKDRAVAGAPLHTSFNLNSSGEYLALVNSNGTVVSEFAPSFPDQFSDVSYGVVQQVTTTTLVSNTTLARVLIPTNSSLATNWTLAGFDDSAWIAGTNGVGYQNSVPGFAIRNFKANLQVTTVTDAESVISTPSKQSAVYLENRNVVNYHSTGGGANYGGDYTFPGLIMGVDVDDFVLEATGFVTIPAAGNWTFDVSSDDGFSLTVGTFAMSYPGVHGTGDTLQTFNFPAAGEYPLRLVYFERGGGAQVEMSAAQGGFTTWNPTNFRLVGDTANGGLAVRSMAQGSVGFLPHIKTDVQTSMTNQNATAYLRLPFLVADTASFQTLTLLMKYDDGFVAYLNGTEVARRNAPATPDWNSAATSAHANTLAVVEEAIDLTPALGTLVTGANVLAIHGLNDSADGDDFLIAAQLKEFKTVLLTNQFFSVPTPGTFNDSTPYYAKVGDTKFSHDRGLYETNITVEITCATTGAVIRCTLDGSAPSLTNGFIYTNALPITNTTTLRAAGFKDGHTPSDVDTHTYIFIRDVLKQGEGVAPGPGWPAPGRVGNQNPAQIIDYGLAADILTNAAYAGEMSNDLRAIPTFSVVMSLPDLFDPARGVYVNASVSGDSMERPCSLELILPDGSQGFQANCGIRTRGGYSRSGDNPKHGFRFFFSRDYGPAQLNYALFGTTNGAATSFDKIDLRTFQNYSWSFGGDGNFTGLRDQFSRDMQLALGSAGSHGNYYHLYINGQYWGIYNTDERPEENYGASYFGGTAEQYDVIKTSGDVGYNIYATAGSMDAWFRLWQQATNGFPDLDAYMRAQGNNRDGTRNPAYENLLDVDNLIDYMLVHLYSGDIDAPISNFLNNDSPNNIFLIRNTNNTAGYRFITHDAEHTLFLQNCNVTGCDFLHVDRFGPYNAGDPVPQGTGAFSKSNPGYLFTKLLANSEFKMRLADRIQKNCYRGGPMTVEANLARYMARSNEMYRAVVVESARWGNSKRTPSFTRADWVAAVNSSASFIQQRTDILLGQFQSKALLPSLAAPMLSLWGGNVPSGTSLTLTNPNVSGQIYYTLDGSDPRLPGGDINAAAVVYSTNLSIITHAFVRARVKNPSTNEWSALVEATFYVDQDFSKLIVSELMYNPPGFGPITGDLLEFLELKNVGDRGLDLSGLGFSDGIVFSFPAGTTIEPGQHFLLARSPGHFAIRYPGVTVHGTYTGKLDSAGEKIAITNNLGATVLSFTYDDAGPWPAAADGFGFSIVAANASAPFDDDEAANWRAGSALYGSPGTDDPAASIPPILVNELLTHETLTQPDAVELYNPTATNVDVGGWFLTDDRAWPTKYRLPDNSVIPPGGFLALDETHFNPNPGVPPSFSFSSHGEEVYLFSGDTTTNLTGYSHGFAFGGAAPGVSFGRYLDSVGDEHFPSQSSLTLGTNNAGPLVGPVVINEIMYHPFPGGDEFVELKNITGSAVPLYDPAFPTNVWRLNGLGYVFPTNAQIEANGFVLLAGIDPAVFRAKYGVPSNVPIYGPFAGALQDSGERLELQQPGIPDTNGVPLITVDEVRYNDKAPWPVAADGDGPSLQRLVAAAYGNDPTNWFTSGMTPGGENFYNTPPAVSLTSPTNNASFAFPTAITLQAAATDSDGTVAQVEFFQNGLLVATLTSSPFTLVWTNVAAGSYTLTARATDNGFASTVSAPVQITVTPPPTGTGLGLKGEYYDNMDFTGTLLTRTNATVNFDWGTGSPDPAMGVDSFSVRWTGMVQPRYSDTYTFYTTTDDGVRLWVNGVLIIDHWGDQSPTEWSGSIALLGGQFYNIRMDMFENGGGAVAMLAWASAYVSKDFIPQTQLYPVSMPSIITQPVSRAVAVGATVTWNVVATNSPTGYQWGFNGTLIPGATNASFTITNAQFTNAGSYTVTVSNAYGSVVSVPAALTVMLPPAITTQPQSQTTNEGATVAFNVIVEGTPPFYYQWRFYGTNLPGAINPALTVNDVHSANTGPYSVLVSNAAASTLSSNATLTVLAPVTILAHPTNITFSSTNLVTTNKAYFSVFAVGLGPVAYQWQFWGTNLPGATNATMVISNVGLAHAGPYLALATDSVRTVPSETANLLLKVKPFIYVQPQSQTTVTNGLVTLSVLAGPIHPTLPLSYRWRKAGLVIVPNGGPTLTLVMSNVTALTNQYSAVLSNAYGVTVNSANALVVILADSDRDGLPDNYETAVGLSPTNASDAMLDLDGDGMNNAQEYTAGTSPTNAQSLLQITLPADALGNGQLQFRFTAISNKTYSVEFTDVLDGGGWSNLVSIDSLPTNRLLSITNTFPAGVTNRFYRLKLPLNP